MSKIPDKAFKLKFDDNDNIDFVMSEGSIDTIEGRDEWLQANRLGLIGQEGDWLFDPTEGLPWVNHDNLPPGRMHIMGQSPPPKEDLIRVYVYEQLEKEPRNEQIKDLSVEWEDKAARHLKAEARIVSVDELEGKISI